MEKTFYESISEYVKKGRSSFHTPGHKGHNIFDIDALKLDLTELPETDSLYEADGIIFTLEKAAQKLFGSKRTLVSSGGNTLCIQAALRLCAPSGGKIICGRTIHRSAVGAMALLGINPEWILPVQDAGEGLSGRIHPKDIQKSINKNPDAKAVYITSPDYYGVICDIYSISKECKKYGIPLIVDNAHGSHFKFMEKSMHPIDLGACISADSVHKTLPVMTSGALLHISDEKFIDRAKGAMALFGSTSPSYPIMASIDRCIDWIFKNGHRAFRELISKSQEIRYEAISKGIIMPKGPCDPARISLDVSSIGYSGKSFMKYLYKYKIEPELYDSRYVVFIPSPFNTSEDWERLKRAIIDAKQGGLSGQKWDKPQYFLPQKEVSLREALMSECIRIPITSALGRIAGEITCPCPPGVPIVMPGELIGKNESDALLHYGIKEINVIK